MLVGDSGGHHEKLRRQETFVYHHVETQERKGTLDVWSFQGGKRADNLGTFELTTHKPFYGNASEYKPKLSRIRGIVGNQLPRLQR